MIPPPLGGLQMFWNVTPITQEATLLESRAVEFHCIWKLNYAQFFKDPVMQKMQINNKCSERRGKALSGLELESSSFLFYFSYSQMFIVVSLKNENKISSTCNFNW